MKNIDLIGYASGISAGNAGCAQGPIYLQQSQWLDSDQLSFEWREILEPTDQKQGLEALQEVTKLCENLASITEKLTLANKPFATIGGDHACAVGTWSGVAQALAPQGDLGLIWSDAHMDAHTFDTTPSGNIHGMPIACLLGHGDPSLTHIASKQPKIKPEHLCLIGIRDFEAGEAELLKQLDVRIITMEEVQQRGFEDCMQEALTIANNGTAGFGISIDLDGFDPKQAPAVGTPVANGLDAPTFCDF